MISKHDRVRRIFLISSAASWVLLLIVTSYSALNSSSLGAINFGAFLIKNLFLSLFFLSTFLYYRTKKQEFHSYNFSEMIWRAFIAGALILFALFITKQFNVRNSSTELVKDHLYSNLIYNVNIVFITVFCAKLFYLFKDMILYDKNRLVYKAWNVYEVLILTCVIFNLFIKEDLIGNYFAYALIVGISMYGLILSLNMRWVAYLNMRQKLYNILIVFLILLISLTLFQYIYSKSSLSYHSLILNDLGKSVFIINVFGFIIFYCISALLVSLFNLPTSSVFEQKMEEVINFRKLSQTIQRIDEEDQVYDILLETCFSTSLADAAWLEIVDRKDNYAAFLNKEIDKYDVFEIKKVVKRNQYNFRKEELYIKNLVKLDNSSNVEDMSYRSLIMVPLYFHDKTIGILGLLKNVHDGFSKEVLELVKSFVGQASISIENSRLVTEAIEHERYKEEIKIARSVQQNLIPDALVYNSHFHISSFSESADDIGGDYFDSYVLDENRTAVVIADVSGHGTSAAFNMAQLKGVLQSLMLLNLPMEQFLAYTNKALCNCLKKKTFITMSVYVIDTKLETFSVARAGHCPTLYYDHKRGTCEYLKTKGLGLGILRGDEYENYIEVFTQKYSKDDVLFIYTDGVVEATNEENEELGYERLKEVFSKNVDQNAKVIVKNVMDDMYSFCGDKKLTDDYTCLALKFA